MDPMVFFVEAKAAFVTTLLSKACRDATRTPGAFGGELQGK